MSGRQQGAVGRLKTLTRQLLADVLAVGSGVSSGPVLSPTAEAELLDAIEARLSPLLERHGQEPDGVLAERFRQAHPELFRGGLEERRRAARGDRSDSGEGGRPG